MVEECSWWKSDICNIKIRETRNPWVSARQKWVMSLFTSDNVWNSTILLLFFLVSQESDIDGGSGVSPNCNLKYLFRTHQLILITMLQHGKCLHYHVELKG